MGTSFDAYSYVIRFFNISCFHDNGLTHDKLNYIHLSLLLLAHLSQELIGELMDTHGPASGRRPSVVVVNNFKHLLLQYGLPDQSQILCGASLGRGTKSLLAASGSHDQDGCHAHIW